MAADDGRARELKQFLRAMRARIRPQDVGVPESRARRRPGLRVDEAAAAAGVGLTWYTALEAGKGIRVSAKLLGRVADALRLTAAERQYLFALARPRPEMVAALVDDASLRAVIDGFTDGPAFVCDRFWTVLATNELADRVYGHDTAVERNLLVRMMVDDGFRALHADWPRIARQMVAIFHFALGEAPDDDGALAVLERLRASSPEFRDWWDAFALQRYEPTDALLNHPVAGRLRLRFTCFVAAPLATQSDRLMLVLQPPVDAATRERLAALRGGPARAPGG